MQNSYSNITSSCQQCYVIMKHIIITLRMLALCFNTYVYSILEISKHSMENANMHKRAGRRCMMIEIHVIQKVLNR
jgi:hypothetical protein